MPSLQLKNTSLLFFFLFMGSETEIQTVKSNKNLKKGAKGVLKIWSMAGMNLSLLDKSELLEFV